MTKSISPIRKAHKTNRKRKQNSSELITKYNNILTVTDEGRKYLKSHKITENDPAFYIEWYDENLDNSILGLFGGQIMNLNISDAPHYIANINSTSQFKKNIIEYLAGFGGGNHSGDLISPNTLNEITNILTNLRDIANSNFVQALVTYSHGPLGRIHIINNPRTMKINAVNFPAPEQPLVVVFE